MKLKDKVAIITGSGAGIGKAIAERFAREGAAVVCCSRRESNGRPVAEKITDQGGRALFVACDVSKEEDVKRAVEAGIEAYGCIDILVNNAGVNFSRPFECTASEDWDRVIDTDLRGTFLFCRYCIPNMLLRKKGSILNIASNHTAGGYPGSAPYDAAKWGVIGFTKALATEFASRGIRINALSPGLIDTQIWEDLKNASPSRQECEQYWYSNIPSGRVGRPEEVAAAAAFMVSDEASYLVGSNVILDGGASSLLVSKPPFESENLDGGIRQHSEIKGIEGTV